LSPGGRDRAAWRSLRGRREFSRVYEKGVKQVGRLFVLFLYPGDEPARAVVASRKVGGAVARNRAKRLLREAIRSLIEDVPGSAGDLRRRYFPGVAPGEAVWLVAVARRDILAARGQDVAAELGGLLDRGPAGRSDGIDDDPPPAAGDRQDRPGARG
jgi:hypothetical protein